MSDILEQLAQDAENTFYSLSLDNVEEVQPKNPVQTQNLNDMYL
ncbi:MAG: hypothetical protein PUD59_06680 [bacterium]|nr:hypothetical protein [bacterium]